MLIKRTIATSMAATFCLLLSVLAYSGQVSEWLLGKWVAQSRGTVAVHGDMEVRKDRIFWERHGWVKYKVISETTSSILIDLERSVDCGKVVRFGPYPETGTSSSALQMAEYPSLEHAASKGGDLWKSGACGWGVYNVSR